MYVCLLLKGKCNDFLTYYFIVLLYYIIDKMSNFFNIIENKLSQKIYSSKVALFCILPFLFRFEGATGKISLEAEVESSKWLNRDRTKN